MKISGIVYMHIINIYLIKNPSGLHNNLNPRLELLAGMNDDLPVKVSHYSCGHDLEGGQGDMRAFIDLSLKNEPHKII